MRRVLPGVVAAATALMPVAVTTATARAACTPEVAIHDTGQYEGSLNAANALVFTVDVAPGCGDPGTVAYRTKVVAEGKGWAAPPGDYTAVQGVLQVGQGPLAVAVPLVSDPDAEGDEVVVVELHDPQGVAIAGAGIAYGTVLDDDSMGMSLDGGKICWEPEAVDIPVDITAAPEAPVTVDFEVFGGTAVAGVHYAPVRGTLTIPAGAPGGVIRVPLLPGADREPDRYFLVQLSNPSAGTIGVGRAAVTVRPPA
ncbi:Calx-beta domain-containing protein [Actinosynnema sp. NPDC059335]|uniref:Calx-beta domain-containing protein n=1 Tax=Actinosynnema sp. NPDC059335 TaxID=3346804 RepID=UPI0036734191